MLSSCALKSYEVSWCIHLGRVGEKNLRNNTMIPSGSGRSSLYKPLPIWFCSDLECSLPLCIVVKTNDESRGNNSQTATLGRECTETINETWSVSTFFILQVEMCMVSYYLINSWAQWQILNTVLTVLVHTYFFLFQIFVKHIQKWPRTKRRATHMLNPINSVL